MTWRSAFVLSHADSRQRKEIQMSEESKSETGDGWREVVHIVNNIRKGHPYLDALEILCSAVEESDKWSERKRVLEAKAEAGFEKPEGTWCPECGPNVKVDEEGLCVSCGATAIGLLERAESSRTR